MWYKYFWEYGRENNLLILKCLRLVFIPLVQVVQILFKKLDTHKIRYTHIVLYL